MPGLAIYYGGMTKEKDIVACKKLLLHNFFGALHPFIFVTYST